MHDVTLGSAKYLVFFPPILCDMMKLQSIHNRTSYLLSRQTTILLYFLMRYNQIIWPENIVKFGPVGK